MMAKNSRKVHLRGVAEDLSEYGTSAQSVQPELKKAMNVVEDLFVVPFELVPGVQLNPGRLITKRKALGVYELTPLGAALARGIVDLPEVNLKKLGTKRSPRTK